MILSLVDKYKQAIKPQQKNGADARHKLILNFLLLNSLFLNGFAIIVNCGQRLWLHYHQLNFHHTPLIILIITFFSLILIYGLNRHGHLNLSSCLFIICLWLPTAYSSWRWADLLEQTILFYALIIVFSCILLKPIISFSLTGLTSFYLLLVNYLQRHHLISYDQLWHPNIPGSGHILIVSFTLLILALVGWLAVDEAEQALERARALEKSLQHKLALLHDIRNPLTSAWLSLEVAQEIKAQANQPTKQQLNHQLNHQLGTTLSSLKQANQLLDRTHHTPSSKQSFKPIPVIHKTLKILRPQAEQLKIKLHFKHPTSTPSLNGDPFRLKQIVSNLVINALEAYQGHSTWTHRKKQIMINLQQLQARLKLQIVDFGSGIEPEAQTKIFQPHYSTKKSADNFGLGLNIVQAAVQDHFHGQLKLNSTPDKTIFTVTLPQGNKHH